MIKTKINGKWELLLPKHRQEIWSKKGGWEKDRLESMNKHLTKNDVLYYIGAEEGDMPALCASWGVKVVMFEPNRKVWANIKEIWEANKLPDPWNWIGFASDKNSGLALSNNLNHISGDIITDHGFMELINRNAPEITVDKMNNMLSYDPGIPLTALSIDVEGAEWLVLKGAEETLKKDHPKIWLSLHPAIIADKYPEKSPDDIRSWLKGLGYSETFLDDEHEMHLFYEKADFDTKEKDDLK